MICSSSEATALFVFGSLAAIIAHNPLIFGTCPEPNVYHASRLRPDVDLPSRAMHLGLLFILLACFRAEEKYDRATTALYILISFLPLIWFMGLLPTTSALWSWTIEQYNVLALGGSPARSDTRATVMAVLGSIAVTVVWAIYQKEAEEQSPDLTATMSVAALLGFLLSWDWARFYQTLVTFSRRVRLLTKPAVLFSSRLAPA